MGAYFPDRGDVVWISFDPQKGHEQAGRRPALTLSPETYNRKTGLAIFCPVTRQEKGYPFEVRMPTGLPIAGVALSDEIKSLDWRGRKAEFYCRISQETLTEVLAKLKTLIGLDL